MFWHLSGATTAYNFETPINSNITLIAKWQDAATVEYWQVTWNLNGGAFPTPSNHTTQVVKGGTLAEPNEPTRASYTFDGWYREAALTNKVTFPYNVSSVTANITLYAKWTSSGGGNPGGNICQIEWALNGGWFAGGSRVTSISRGSNIDAPTQPPARINYTFEGWYLDAELTNKVTFPYRVMEDITLYAKWGGFDENANEEYADCFGSWRMIDTWGINWEHITVSGQKIIFITNSGTGYMIEGLTWTETSSPHADYPTGYRITGTIMYRNSNYLFQGVDGQTGGINEGSIAAINLYFSNNKQGFMLLGPGIGSYTARTSGPYIPNNAGYWQVAWELNGGYFNSVTRQQPSQVPKDGRIATPTHTPRILGSNDVFNGWYDNAQLSGSRITFPYSPTGDLTFYADWLTPEEPTVTLRFTVQSGVNYTTIAVIRRSAGTPSRYNSPTSAGTHTVMVTPGTYYFLVEYSIGINTYRSTTTDFTVTAGQTRTITIGNGTVIGFQ
jgi:uncharacterized repeat protein (TIGR02543 family)